MKSNFQLLNEGFDRLLKEAEEDFESTVENQEEDENKIDVGDLFLNGDETFKLLDVQMDEDGNVTVEAENDETGEVEEIDYVPASEFEDDEEISDDIELSEGKLGRDVGATVGGFVPLPGAAAIGSRIGDRLEDFIRKYGKQKFDKFKKDNGIESDEEAAALLAKKGGQIALKAGKKTGEFVKSKSDKIGNAVKTAAGKVDKEKIANFTKKLRNRSAQPVPATEALHEQLNEIEEQCRQKFDELQNFLLDGVTKESTCQDVDCVNRIKQAFRMVGGRVYVKESSPTYVAYEGNVNGYTIGGSVGKGYVMGDLNRLAEDLTMAYNVSLGGEREYTPGFIKRLVSESYRARRLKEGFVKLNNEPIEIDYIETDDVGYAPMFKWDGKRYNLNDFIRCHNNPWGEIDCPDYIHAYDSTNYYNPIFIGLDDSGEYVDIYEQSEMDECLHENRLHEFGPFGKKKDSKYYNGVLTKSGLNKANKESEKRGHEKGSVASDLQQALEYAGVKGGVQQVPGEPTMFTLVPKGGSALDKKVMTKVKAYLGKRDYIIHDMEQSGKNVTLDITNMNSESYRRRLKESDDINLSKVTLDILRKLEAMEIGKRCMLNVLPNKPIIVINDKPSYKIKKVEDPDSKYLLCSIDGRTIYATGYNVNNFIDKAADKINSRIKKESYRGRSIKEAKSSSRKKVTQKYLKDLIKSGKAENLNTWTDDQLKELQKKHYETIAVSFGINGMNGILLQDDDGKLYAVPSRSSTMFQMHKL